MLLRERERPEFTAREAAFVASLSRHLAHGVRTALLIAQAGDDSAEGGPGVVILDAFDEVEELTPAAAVGLDELGADAAVTAGFVPAALVAVAGRARAVAARPDAEAEPARARARGRSGRWLTLNGSVVGAGGRVAIVVAPASPVELAPLVAGAYGLTRREQDVAALLLQGLSTGEMARRLWVSPHTVHDHVKSIYVKTGVRGRAELVALVFYGHAQPRLVGEVEPAGDGWFRR